MKIDAHHHLWQYDPKEYDWIDDSMKAIRSNFLPEHLAKEIHSVGIDGVVTVQARQTIQETEWMLGLAGKNAFMRGVVGWVPLVDPKVEATLARFAPNKKLKAIRHVVQGEPDLNYILRPDFNNGVTQLKKFGLVYDILIFEKQLPPAIQFVDRHPNQVFVLDHIAKPRIKENIVSPWRENLKELAKRPNVYCKISGMTTEADYHLWTEKQLDPYFDAVLNAFEPKRLMFGSDWPVCLVAVSYQRWFKIVSSKIAKLSATEQARILGGTAVEAYKL